VNKANSLMHRLLIVALITMWVAVALSAWQIISPVPAYAVDCDHRCGSSGGWPCETGCDLCHMKVPADPYFHCLKHFGDPD
jgi:hypothetical protein